MYRAEVILTGFCVNSHIFGNSHGILRKFIFCVILTGFNENHLKIQDGCKIEHGLCLHLYCLAIFYVYRDTIAAPGPVSLLSYIEKLITAGTR